MTLWDSIKQQFANFGADTGQFALKWWPGLVFLVVVISIVGLAINGHRRMRVDPSVPFTPEELTPLDEDVKVLLAQWRQDHDVLEDIRLALDKVLSEEEQG